MPFKRAGLLQRHGHGGCDWHGPVSMPFKRAGLLQHDLARFAGTACVFQCPLSGQVCCNVLEIEGETDGSVSMPFKRAGLLQLPRIDGRAWRHRVSMPFKRAGLLQPAAVGLNDGRTRVSMPFKRAGLLQLARAPRSIVPRGFNAL